MCKNDNYYRMSFKIKPNRSRFACNKMLFKMTQNGFMAVKCIMIQHDILMARVNVIRLSMIFILPHFTCEIDDYTQSSTSNLVTS